MFTVTKGVGQRGQPFSGWQVTALPNWYNWSRLVPSSGAAAPTATGPAGRLHSLTARQGALSVGSVLLGGTLGAQRDPRCRSRGNIGLAGARSRTKEPLTCAQHVAAGSTDDLV